MNAEAFKRAVGFFLLVCLGIKKKLPEAIDVIFLL